MLPSCEYPCPFNLNFYANNEHIEAYKMNCNDCQVTSLCQECCERIIGFTLDTNRSLLAATQCIRIFNFKISLFRSVCSSTSFLSWVIINYLFFFVVGKFY